MFTGLIQKVGQLVKVENTADGGIITIGHDPWNTPLAEGESVAVQGVCLTVTRYASDQFACNVLGETLARTNLASKRPGAPLNLERALRAGDRFGGHFVSGHVDGVGKVVSVDAAGGDRSLEIGCDEELVRDIVLKGSIACDGVSLTVTGTSAVSFEVNIIPFTRYHTTLGEIEAGGTVNLETDMLGKYVRRYMEARGSESRVEMEDLRNAGFL